MKADHVDPVFFITLHSAMADPAQASIKEELTRLHDRFQTFFSELDAKLGKFVIVKKPFGVPLNDLEVRFRGDLPPHEGAIFQELKVNIGFLYMALATIQTDIMGDIQAVFNKMTPGKIPAIVPTITKLWESVQCLRDAAWKLTFDEEVKKAMQIGQIQIEDFAFVQDLKKLRVFL